MLLMPLANAFAQPSPATNCHVSDTVGNSYNNTCGSCNGAYTANAGADCAPICCVLTTVDTIGTWFFWAVLMIAFIMMIWGAMQFMTAGGDEEQTGQARQTLIYALIGVAIAYFSQLLIDMVSNILT